MAADFPTSLHDFSATYTDDTAQETTHPGIHNDLNEEVAAVQTKIGVDSSAVVTSLDYLLKNTSSTDPGHKHTLANSATDVTATAGEINGAIDGCTATAAELNICDNGQTAEKVLNTQCKCSAYLSADQENIADLTNTKVTLDSERYDIGSDFDTTNNRFVAPVTGYYLVTGCVSAKNTITNKAYHTVIYVNGSAYARAIGHSGGLAASVSPVCTTIAYVESGQYVELYAYFYCGAATVDVDSTIDRTYLAIHLLSI